MILALLSTIGGFLGVPESLGGSNRIDEFLHPVFKDAQVKMMGAETNAPEIALMVIAVAAAWVSIWYAYKKYVQDKEVPVPDGQHVPAIQNVLYHKYYVDEIYAALITKPLDKISGFLESIVETRFIDSIVNKLGTLVQWTGGVIRQLQSGNVDFYIFAMVVGVVLMIFFKMM
jgi:NADH-quinone oxidoreductase subunit L